MVTIFNETVLQCCSPLLHTGLGTKVLCGTRVNHACVTALYCPVFQNVLLQNVATTSCPYAATWMLACSRPVISWQMSVFLVFLIDPAHPVDRAQT